MNPLVVEVTRGSVVESKHLAHVVVCDDQGKIIKSWGDAEQLVYPRSAIKMIQALSLLESGAVEKYKLEDRHISIACASHWADEKHISVVQEWLEKIGLTELDLECGAHAPSDKNSAEQLIRQNKVPNSLHNNCSGKHCGMLTTALQMGWPTKGYSQWDHPVQIRLRKILSEISGFDYEKSSWGTDGCSIPTYAIPLHVIAKSMAVMISRSGISELRQWSTSKILKAVKNEPHMISGTNGLCSEIVRLTQGRTFAKGGAEGVYTALIPEKGLSMALKISDGAGRASEVAVAKLLHDLGGLTGSEFQDLKNRILPSVQNCNGKTVGEIRLSE